MIHAVETPDGAVAYFVDIDPGAPPYIPPSGMTMREATPEEIAAVNEENGVTGA